MGRRERKREFDIIMLLAGLAFLPFMAWNLGYRPWKTAEIKKHFTVQVDGSSGVAFEATVSVFGQPTQKLTGRIPRTYDFNTKGIGTITVMAKKTEQFGELKVAVLRDGKPVQEKSTMVHYGSVMATGN